MTTGPGNGMDAGDAAQTTGAPSSLRAFLLYFLRLGTLGFGGPIAGSREIGRAHV